MLSITDLTISIKESGQNKNVVNKSSFSLMPGESLGIVGESGSGKTITALAILQLLPPGMKISSGTILFQNEKMEDTIYGEKPVELNRLNQKQMQAYRGRVLSMIFQEPMTSLNPSMRCSEQIAESIRHNTELDNLEVKNKTESLLREVHLPSEPVFIRKYPHELSGGQRQRIMIAMALAGDPDILIADEPTTALDVTVQKKILELLKEIQQNRQMSMLFISHDLGVIRMVCENAIVMYRGNIVESGKVKDLFTKPQHSYTKGLIACRPVPGSNPDRLPTLADFEEEASGDKLTDKQTIPASQKTPLSAKKPGNQQENNSDPADTLLEVKHFNARYTLKRNLWGAAVKKFHAVNNVSFCIREGETLGLIGESGCGKSTLGRSIIRLIRKDEGEGEILYRGKNILSFKGKELKNFRQKVQFIFQDPYSSLNPKIAAGPSIMEVMKVHGIESGTRERRGAVNELLEKVGLEKEHFDRYPHEFSGGQRQRIGLARALATHPELIICDESVSSLDVSVQAMILNLLNDLKDSYKLTYLFISHDLSVVRYMSDRILVMKDGKLVELGTGDEIFSNPSSEYTRELIDSVPE